MKNYKVIVFLLFPLILSLAPATCHAGNECVTNPPNLCVLGQQEANTAVNWEVYLIAEKKTKKICPEYITNLVEELRNGNLDNAKTVLGIYLLGEMRPTDTNAVHYLIQHIDLKPLNPESYESLGPRWQDYPASEALVKIKEPSISPILNNLPGETNDLRRHLMCDVLKQVEGKSRAQTDIQQRLAMESDATRRNFLNFALKELEK